MAYYDFLNILFAPLLKLPAAWAIIIVSFVFSLISILITKYTSDQAVMKIVKEKIDGHKKELKELRKDKSKLKEMQQKSIEMNKLALEQMRHSFKPLLFTSLPIILLLLPWMSSTFAFESIKPQQEFMVSALLGKGSTGEIKIILPESVKAIGNQTQQIENDKAAWTLKGDPGEHLLEFAYGNEKQQTSVLITDKDQYINPIKKTNGKIKALQINYKKKTIIPIGYKDWFGWLGTYIISSIIFTMLLRKYMKVY